MIFCTKCGKQNSDSAKFCTNCGNPLVKAAKPDEQQTPAPPVPLKTDPVIPTQQKSVQPEPFLENETAPEEHKPFQPIPVDESPAQSTSAENIYQSASAFVQKSTLASIPNIVQEKTVTQAGNVSSSAGTKSNKSLFIIIGCVIVLGIAIGAYFLFFKNKENTNTTVTNSVSTDTNNTVQKSSLPAEDNTAKIPPVTTGNSSPNKTLIAQSDNDEISMRLKNFYEADDKEDINSVLSYFAFPVKRYYQTYGVSSEKMKSMFESTFSSKLIQHKININWSNSTIQKKAFGYEIKIDAIYQYITQSSPQDLRSRNINVTIQMNNAKEITSLYEN